jgi:hypothetical protein
MAWTEDNLPRKTGPEKFTFSKKMWKIERAKIMRKNRAARGGAYSHSRPMDIEIPRD